MGFFQWLGRLFCRPSALKYSARKKSSRGKGRLSNARAGANGSYRSGVNRQAPEMSQSTSAFPPYISSPASRRHHGSSSQYRGAHYDYPPSNPTSQRRPTRPSKSTAPAAGAIQPARGAKLSQPTTSRRTNTRTTKSTRPEHSSASRRVGSQPTRKPAPSSRAAREERPREHEHVHPAMRPGQSSTSRAAPSRRPTRPPSGVHPALRSNRPAAPAPAPAPRSSRSIRAQSVRKESGRPAPPPARKSIRTPEMRQVSGRTGSMAPSQHHGVPSAKAESISKPIQQTGGPSIQPNTVPEVKKAPASSLPHPVKTEPIPKPNLAPGPSTQPKTALEAKKDVPSSLPHPVKTEPAPKPNVAAGAPSTQPKTAPEAKKAATPSLPHEQVSPFADPSEFSKPMPKPQPQPPVGNQKPPVSEFKYESTDPKSTPEAVTKHVRVAAPEPKPKSEPEPGPRHRPVNDHKFDPQPPITPLKIKKKPQQPAPTLRESTIPVRSSSAAKHPTVAQKPLPSRPLSKSTTRSSHSSTRSYSSTASSTRHWYVHFPMKSVPEGKLRKLSSHDTYNAILKDIQENDKHIWVYWDTRPKKIPGRTFVVTVPSNTSPPAIIEAARKVAKDCLIPKRSWGSK